MVKLFLSIQLPAARGEGSQTFQFGKQVTFIRFKRFDFHMTLVFGQELTVHSSSPNKTRLTYLPSTTNSRAQRFSLPTSRKARSLTLIAHSPLAGRPARVCRAGVSKLV